MARITVAYEALERGQFPPVCCKTGVATENYVRWRFVQTPGWTWILLPFGFIPFLIARMFATKEFDGVLPMAPNVIARLNMLRRVVMACVVLAIAGLAGGFVASGWAIGGLVFLVAGVIAMIVATILSPDCRRDLHRGAAELSSVHKRFVETIEAAWAQQRTDQQT